MEIWTSIGREGMQQGMLQGKEELIVGLIMHRFGSVSEEIAKRLDQLSSEQLNALGVAILDFTSRVELENWIEQHSH